MITCVDNNFEMKITTTETEVKLKRINTGSEEGNLFTYMKYGVEAYEVDFKGNTIQYNKIQYNTMQ